MAFIRKKNPTYRWPVAAETPNDGTFETESFHVIFRRLGRSAIGKLSDKSDVDFLEAVLEDWEDVQGEDGKVLPCTPATRKEMFDDPLFVKAVLKAYMESIDAAQEKN